MKIQIATSWGELNIWQKKEIAYLLLSFNLQEQASIQSFYIALLKILVMRNQSLWGSIRWQHLLHQVPISQLLTYVEDFLQQKDIFDFPYISPKLSPPKARMSNCSIKQFSVCDAIFYKYKSEENPQKKELYAKQLVASIYVLNQKTKDSNLMHFDAFDLPKIAQITDSIDLKMRSLILFTYLCVREYIINRFPKIFPTSKNVQEDTPIFHSKAKYTPFSKVIQAMAMDQYQPLGNLHQCNNTLIFDFLDILQESIIRQEKMAKL